MDVPIERALVAFAVPGVVLAGFQITDAGLPAIPAALPVVVVLGSFGLAHVAAPRTIIGIRTFFELIGMRGREHVEPQGWDDWLTRALGAAFLLVAFVVAGGLSYG